MQVRRVQIPKFVVVNDLAAASSSRHLRRVNVENAVVPSAFTRRRQPLISVDVIAPSSRSTTRQLRRAQSLHCVRAQVHKRRPCSAN